MKSKTLVGGVTLDGQFADRANDSMNYQLTVDVPENALYEHHKSVTYYLWFVQHKSEGGSASKDASVTIDLSSVQAATVEMLISPNFFVPAVVGELVSVSPDLLPHPSVRGSAVMGIRDRARAFTGLDTVTHPSRKDEDRGFTEAVDAIMSRWRLLPRTVIVP